MAWRVKNGNYLFTSESVCAGHPDKICDQVSDAVVDAVLAKDPEGHVAVETLVTKNKLVMAGEVTAKAKLDYEKIARERVRRLGYTDPAFDFTDRSSVEVYIHEQSREIAVGVNGAQKKKGAGDQGMMFGFACRETKDLMPLPITLAHRLTRAVDSARENGVIDYLRPDGKSQVTVVYEKGKPIGVTNVVLAVPHKETITLETVKADLYKKVVVPVLAEFGYEISIRDLVVNGTGVWHKGGPASDTGVTGRKIIVDGYGGYARVGGGAFSGKDPTKVDRSGAYAARFLAKNIVAAGLADKAEVSLAYFIGAKKPVMQEVETFGTAKVSKKALRDFMHRLLDCSVESILERLDLQKPIFLPTAVYGHFGRSEFPWERVVG